MQTSQLELDWMWDPEWMGANFGGVKSFQCWISAVFTRLLVMWICVRSVQKHQGQPCKSYINRCHATFVILMCRQGWASSTGVQSPQIPLILLLHPSSPKWLTMLINDNEDFQILRMEDHSWVSSICCWSRPEWWVTAWTCVVLWQRCHLLL